MTDVWKSTCRAALNTSAERIVDLLGEEERRLSNALEELSQRAITTSGDALRDGLAIRDRIEEVRASASRPFESLREQVARLFSELEKIVAERL